MSRAGAYHLEGQDESPGTSSSTAPGPYAESQTRGCVAKAAPVAPLPRCHSHRPARGCAPDATPALSPCLVCCSTSDWPRPLRTAACQRHCLQQVRGSCQQVGARCSDRLKCWAGWGVLCEEPSESCGWLRPRSRRQSWVVRVGSGRWRGRMHARPAQTRSMPPAMAALGHAPFTHAYGTGGEAENHASRGTAGT